MDVRMLVPLAGIIAAVFLTDVAQARGDPRRGEAIARKNCATCHAIGRAGGSPNPNAPPFRMLWQRYPLESLEEALAEGISVGHQGGADMPEFAFSPRQIDDLIAFMKRVSAR
jgi:cytochrome c